MKEENFLIGFFDFNEWVQSHPASRFAASHSVLVGSEQQIAFFHVDTLFKNGLYLFRDQNACGLITGCGNAFWRAKKMKKIETKDFRLESRSINQRLVCSLKTEASLSGSGKMHVCD